MKFFSRIADAALDFVGDQCEKFWTPERFEQSRQMDAKIDVLISNPNLPQWIQNLGASTLPMQDEGANQYFDKVASQEAMERRKTDGTYSDIYDVK